MVYLSTPSRSADSGQGSGFFVVWGLFGWLDSAPNLFVDFFKTAEAVTTSR
jgi:hypothetical protein